MAREIVASEGRRAEAGGDGSAPVQPEPPPRERSRRRLLVAATLVVVGAAVAGAALAVVSGSEEGSAQDEAATANTASVTVRDLVQSYTVSGTLGYADSRSVLDYRQGTITSLPDEGHVVGRGDVLYRVNEDPVVLFYGSHPAWRTLAEGVSDGRDVLQLERNLRRLGYDVDKDMEIDRHFDWATENAVERWQEDSGLEETGVVALGDVVFLPGTRRIGAVAASAGTGARPGTAVMDTSSTKRVVTAEIDASDQGDIAEGDEVVVDFLNGTTAAGTITEVGKVATASAEESDAQGGGDSASSTITFDVTVDNPGAAGRLDQAPVEVQVADEKATDVLSVPVTALLAVRGGGYAVEVVRQGGRELVAVQPGLYSDGGFVEITGDGIQAGDRVVVPA
jgi:peptidoglycan hydrolase-like protein with peptidoglycan-binding domain